MKPINGNVYVKRIVKEEEIRSSGIVIQKEHEKDSEFVGEVVALDEKIFSDDIEFKCGDKVFFDIQKGESFISDSQEYFLVNHADILGVWE